MHGSRRLSLGGHWNKRGALAEVAPTRSGLIRPRQKTEESYTDQRSRLPLLRYTSLVDHSHA
eukprot:266635-Alexandrium_andersonii.AAC.1